MRVLVVGGGGREHALAWACRRAREDVDVICAPGNGGTSQIAENVTVDVTDAPAIARLAREREAELVVVGPDAAAAAGVADACHAAGVAVFGPTAAAARIESSKSFAKQLMRDAGIPTAEWISGDATDEALLRDFITAHDGRCAVKADGLALGKGVVVCDAVEEALGALDACVCEARFGAAGERVVIEERLHGAEMSVLALSDGRHAWLLSPARDHKRASDGDTGPNTGGMGAVAPVPGLDVEALLDETTTRVIEPCLHALAERGTPFTGCLYAGLMLTDSGIRVLEFNARFGDPEAQVVLPLLEEDAVELFTAAAHGALPSGGAAPPRRWAVGVVAAAQGYPGSVRTGDVITGLDALDPDVLCFHAGTRRQADGELRTSGGRVLSLVATADDMRAAQRSVYENLQRVSFEGMHFRRDIGAATLEANAAVAPR